MQHPSALGKCGLFYCFRKEIKIFQMDHGPCPPVLFHLHILATAPELSWLHRQEVRCRRECVLVLLPFSTSSSAASPGTHPPWCWSREPGTWSRQSNSLMADPFFLFNVSCTVWGGWFNLFIVPFITLAIFKGNQVMLNIDRGHWLFGKLSSITCMWVWAWER